MALPSLSKSQALTDIHDPFMTSKRAPYRRLELCQILLPALDMALGSSRPQFLWANLRRGILLRRFHLQDASLLLIKVDSLALADQHLLSQWRTSFIFTSFIENIIQIAPKGSLLPSETISQGFLCL